MRCIDFSALPFAPTFSHMTLASSEPAGPLAVFSRMNVTFKSGSAIPW